MGRPLGPTLANLCVAHLDNQLVNQQHIFMRVYYSRCMDDVDNKKMVACLTCNILFAEI